MIGTLLQEDIGIEWKDAENVRKLAPWLYANFFIRKNAFARYKPDGSPSCIKDQVDVGVIKRHCTGKQTIGAYTTDPEDDCCLWQGGDIDWHDDDLPTPEGNLKFALAKWTYLEGIGLHPVLEDSNGKGGYHLWLLWIRRLLAREAYSFGHWLVRDHADFGIGKPEVFPKQPSIKKFAKDADDLPPASYGNQMRLPGKHPKREHWSRIWDGSRWLEGTEAIDYLVSRSKSDPALIPQEALEYVPPLPERRPCNPGRWDQYDDTEYWRNYDGDLRTLDIIKLFEDAGMLRGFVGGVQEVLCPWHEEHTTGEGGSKVWPAEDDLFPQFYCHHAHCEGRRIEAVLAWFGKDKVDACCARRFTRDSDPLKQEELDALDKIVTGGDPSKLEDCLDAYRHSPLYSYLWDGYHGEYVTDDERRRRIKAIQDVWQFVPGSGLIPEYIRCALPTTDASVMFHLGSSLALAGHLLNRKVCLQQGMDKLYPNLWVACVGGSTMQRKSSSVNPVRRFLLDDVDYADTLISDTFTMEGLYMQLGFCEADPCDLVPRREHCEELFQQNPKFPKGVGLFHTNEVSILLANLDKNYNAAGKSLLTDWYDCPPHFKKPTKSQGVYYVWRPCVSILGATTLEWLNQSCRESDLAGGFLPRWLFFHGGQKDYHLSNQDQPDEHSWQAVVNEMSRLKELPVVSIAMSKKALDWYDAWQRQLLKRCDLRLTSWAGRLIANAKKVAMIYELTTAPDSRTISSEALEMATRLMDRLLADLRNLMEYHIAFGKEDEKLKKVLKCIKDAGEEGILHSLLLRRLSPVKSKELEEYIITLEDRNQIVVESEDRRNYKVAKRYKFVG